MALAMACGTVPATHALMPLFLLTLTPIGSALALLGLAIDSFTGYPFV